MYSLNFTKILIILLNAFVIWALCGAIMGIGRALTKLETTLLIHVIGAPVITFIVSSFYFRKFHYTSPFKTALIFLSFVMVMDAGLVAPVFEKSFDMFKSIIGTWVPFVLIFLSTYITGLSYKGKNK